MTLDKLNQSAPQIPPAQLVDHSAALTDDLLTYIFPIVDPIERKFVLPLVSKRWNVICKFTLKGNNLCARIVEGFKQAYAKNYGNTFLHKTETLPAIFSPLKYPLSNPPVLDEETLKKYADEARENRKEPFIPEVHHLPNFPLERLCKSDSSPALHMAACFQKMDCNAPTFMSLQVRDDFFPGNRPQVEKELLTNRSANYFIRPGSVRSTVAISIRHRDNAISHMQVFVNSKTGQFYFEGYKYFSMDELLYRLISNGQHAHIPPKISLRTDFLYLDEAQARDYLSDPYMEKKSNYGWDYIFRPASGNCLILSQSLGEAHEPLGSIPKDQDDIESYQSSYQHDNGDILIEMHGDFFYIVSPKIKVRGKALKEKFDSLDAILKAFGFPIKTVEQKPVLVKRFIDLSLHSTG